MKEAEFDQFAHDYTRLASENTRFFEVDHEYFGRVRAGLIARQCRGGVESVLDFGCGIGLSVRSLRTAFPSARICGCDPSGASLAMARVREPHAEFLALDEVPAEARFDVVTAVCVFHHIAPVERDEALRFCYARLRPGGRLFVFEHNPLNPVTRHLTSTCAVDREAILLTKRESAARLRRAGFRIGPSPYYLFFPKPLAALRPLERRMGWMPLGGQYLATGVRP